jgi:hypothetical protein
MKPSKVLLKPLHKRALYLATAILWLSGALWLYYNYFVHVQGDYGPQTHPAQPILLEIHGAVAMVFLVILGTLLTQHVPAGWKQKHQRPSGVLLLAISGFLTLTGWGIYYLVGDNLRRWTSWTHSIVGLALPLIIFIHVQMNKTK